MGRVRGLVSVRSGRWVCLAALVCASLLWANPAHAAVGGNKLWVTRQSGYTTDGLDVGARTAASPDGAKVFVTGTVDLFTEGKNYLTLAQDSATGAVIWSASYNSGGSQDDSAAAVAVNPDGTKVYVTGVANGGWATIALDSSTGAQLWVAQYGAVAPFTLWDQLAVSPDGSKVFIAGTGLSASPSSPEDYATVAYNASTGAQLWVSTWNGPANLNDDVSAIGVTPDGSRVIVTGFNESYRRGDEYFTIAYSAATGARLWFQRYNGFLGNYISPTRDRATSLAISPNGLFVAVTGESVSLPSNDENATVAYSVATGAQLWVARFTNPVTGGHVLPVRAVVSPNSSKVFVTGPTDLGTPDYETIAYEASTGAQVWAQAYDGIGHDYDSPSAVAVSGDGSKVVVTGRSWGGDWLQLDFATVAYDTTTGAQVWVSRHNAAIGSHDYPFDLAMVPGRNSVVVSGASDAAVHLGDHATVMIAL